MRASLVVDHDQIDTPIVNGVVARTNHRAPQSRLLHPLSPPPPTQLLPLRLLPQGVVQGQPLQLLPGGGALLGQGQAGGGVQAARVNVLDAEKEVALFCVWDEV